MSAEIAVTVRDLGKEYVLGERDAYRTLRSAVGSLLGRRRAGKARRDTLWALRDVSFDVERGSVVGIIGHNGAGKSTLLRILSRVTEPTTGQAELIGRVSALLEVGTGFHPELTGRENVFLNGSILGMSQAEIKVRFDDIVDFAELEAFIDTPIKRYSSGMQVRLAFAVAAFLEPEILIVDEVLAVGDVAFQRKCLGRLEAGSMSGRTVLFVSHNLPAIRSLCPRSILLDHGRIVFDGPSEQAIDRYLSTRDDDTNEWNLADAARPYYDVGGRLRLTHASLRSNGEQGTIPVGTRIEIKVEFEANVEVNEVVGVLNLSTLGDVLVAQSVSATSIRPFADITAGRHSLDVVLDTSQLQPGRYMLGFGLRSDQGLEDDVLRAGAVEFVESAQIEFPAFGSGGGYLRLPATWNHTQPTSDDDTHATPDAHTPDANLRG